MPILHRSFECLSYVGLLSAYLAYVFSSVYVFCTSFVACPSVDRLLCLSFVGLLLPIFCRFFYVVHPAKTNLGQVRVA